MSMYEDYDGSEQPNKRPVSYVEKPRRHRIAWLMLILLYMSGCSYWGWQVFLRPDADFADDQGSIIIDETETLVADDHPVQAIAETTHLTTTEPLPPAAPPSSKPASINAQRWKKSGRPLDKMEAETGLIYETDRASPASAQSPLHTDRSGSGPLTDPAAPDTSIEIEYPSSPTIHQKDIPSASQAKRGVSVEQTDEEWLPEPEIYPEPFPLPGQGPIASPPPIYEIEVVQDLPPVEQEAEIIALSETPPPIAEPAQPVIYVEPAPEIIAPPPFHPKFDYDGSFVVQIASFANVEAACSVWDDLRYAHPRLFGDAETIVRRHRADSGRVFYRLRVGAFSKRRHAVDWCLAYREVGGECFVTRR